MMACQLGDAEEFCRA